VRCPSGGFSLRGALGFFFGKEDHLRASNAVLLDVSSAFSHRRHELKRVDGATVERPAPGAAAGQDLLSAAV
jgi:hypothetical protein